ncbi:serine/threonine-protein kinase [Microbacterium dauci]|uniref:non-specific serine/threonine protein kinase n=1 Tax=Microbacterium dauci TaxID=3048008 RepID=A0ABT6ZFT2_9MICO|nr:serine/threonine-protein kinase [Microbacterium sp. LX3-4]MDJ1114841.1 serine/threonine-protein kinase [Microbacterium sp. LX3-4]
MADPDDRSTHTELLDGRYRLGDRLGSGGMADVFRAFDVILGRDVAVKIIRAGADGVTAPERARGEMAALAALNHPSLVMLLDAHLDGEADHEYLVMELVEGPTLRERLATGPLDEQDASHLAAELAEALHVAHTAGIVHRDLKPSNILLTPAQLPGRAFRAKLADFGIAYLVDHTRVTNPGDIIGTAAYLAPEQVNGAVPAPPADIYALGLVLIEALAGEPAFPHAVGVASALARLNAAPELPATLGPGWRDLLERMTRIDPDARPDALEVAVAASALAVTGAVTVSPPLVDRRPASDDAVTDVIPAAGVVAPGAAVAGAVAPPVDGASALTEAVATPTPDPEATGAMAAISTDAAAPRTAILHLGTDGSDAAAASDVRRGRRRGLLIGAATVGAIATLGLGAWGLGAFGSPDDDPVDAPVVTEPSPASTPTPTVTVPAEVVVSNERPVEQEEESPSPTPEPEPTEEVESPEPTPTTPEPEPTEPTEPEPEPEPEPTTPAETPAPVAPSPAPETPAP